MQPSYCGNSSNLRNHMKKWHADTMTQSKDDGRKQVRFEDIDFAPTASKKLSRRSIRIKSITSAIVAYIATDMRPFATIDRKGFLELLAVLELHYDMPCWKTITSL